MIIIDLMIMAYNYLWIIITNLILFEPLDRPAENALLSPGDDMIDSWEYNDAHSPLITFYHHTSTSIIHHPIPRLLFAGLDWWKGIPGVFHEMIFLQFLQIEESGLYNSYKCCRSTLFVGCSGRLNTTSIWVWLRSSWHSGCSWRRFSLRKEPSC